MNNNKYDAFKILEERCKSIVKYNTLYPTEVVRIANDYLYNGGCKTRNDYRHLVIESISNINTRNFLLDN